MAIDINALVRPNIRDMQSYSSARSEFSGSADVYLDANENPFGSPTGTGFNRYPDPYSDRLKRELAKIKNVPPHQIFIGNGSDEAIDLLFRVFCIPRNDQAIVCPPTYGMYTVSAAINDVGVIEVPLSADFQIDTRAVISSFSSRTKLVFFCSPNNPTGNLMDRGAITEIAKVFDGLVVLDEAYIDFAERPSSIELIAEFPNIIVLQTFSKAWGMAGNRIGTAFAGSKIIDVMNKVKPPYNISSHAQEAAIEALDHESVVREWIDRTLSERARLSRELVKFDLVETVFPSDANFLLVKLNDAQTTYNFLLDRGIVVRDRSGVELCDGCLRITVGTTEENTRLLCILKDLDETVFKKSACKPE